jgi:hypothetical protein
MPSCGSGYSADRERWQRQVSGVRVGLSIRNHVQLALMCWSTVRTRSEADVHENPRPDDKGNEASMAFGIERRALARMRTTERDAASRDARNLEDEYRDPTQGGGHNYPTFYGHSLQAGEKARRHICCWFRQDTGSGWSSEHWSKVYVTDSRLLIQCSDGVVVSVWWTVSLQFHEDLKAGRLTLDDEGRSVLLSGTQVEILAVACRHMRDAV